MCHRADASSCPRLLSGRASASLPHIYTRARLFAPSRPHRTGAAPRSRKFVRPTKALVTARSYGQVTMVFHFCLGAHLVSSEGSGPPINAIGSGIVRGKGRSCSVATCGPISPDAFSADRGQDLRSALWRPPVLRSHALVDVGGRVDHRERDALALYHEVAFCARFAPIGRVRTGFGAPRGAGTLDASSDALRQSICSASPRRSSRVWCRRLHTPASSHSSRRLQQVIPLPQPISWGSISHGMPLFSTKIMPVRAARSSMRGRPPSGLGGSGGKSGSTTSQSSSVTSSLAMSLPYPAQSFVSRT